MPDSTHAGIPQSLYGKLQTLRSFADPSGGTSASGIVVQHNTNWGFLLDYAYEGITQVSLWVIADMRSYLIDWMQDKFEVVADTRALGQAALGLLSKLGMVPTTRAQLLVLYNKAAYPEFWSPLPDCWYSGQEDSIQDGIAVPMFISGMKAVGWTVADYPFLQATGRSQAGMNVNLVTKDILASDSYEYDLDNGGLGGNTIIIIGGGAGGLTGQEVMVQRNAYFQLKLTAADPITGYDALPARIRYIPSTQVLAGYVTSSEPVVINFNLADNQRFALTLKTYNVERSAI